MDFFIIDNDPTCREAVGFLLEDEGHTAEGTPWSKDIELRLQLKKCDAILLELDSTLPNALAPLLELRTLRPDLPVVLLVTDDSLKLATEAKRYGGVEILEKPFRREHLVVVTERLQRFRQPNSDIERLKERQNIQPQAP
jgi:two-component system nitrogen regulation response regulator NtrX